MTFAMERTDFVKRLRAARANGDPEKYLAMITVWEAHAIADRLETLTRERDEAREALKTIRNDALEEAAKLIEEGFDRGIARKVDWCPHDKFAWEDCEQCAASAIRALITEEPTT